MTADEYQEASLRTIHKQGLILDEEQALLLETALGCAGESGEFADHVKKHFFQGHPLDKAHLIEELGDSLWYHAVAAHVLGVDFSRVMLDNVEKLKRRFPAGFSSSDSIARVDKA